MESQKIQAKIDSINSQLGAIEMDKVETCHAIAEIRATVRFPSQALTDEEYLRRGVLLGKSRFSIAEQQKRLAALDVEKEILKKQLKIETKALGVAKHYERQAQERVKKSSFYGEFCYVAKSMLTEELFNQLADAAKARIEAQEKEQAAS